MMLNIKYIIKELILLNFFNNKWWKWILSALNGDTPFSILSSDTLPESIDCKKTNRNISSHRIIFCWLYWRMNNEEKIIDKSDDPLFPKNNWFRRLYISKIIIQNIRLIMKSK